MTRYPMAEPLTRAVANRLDDAAAAVIGRTLRRVSYRFGAHSGWPEGYARGDVDEVGMAVVLGFDSRAELIISWVPPGRFESVDIEVGPAGSFAVPEDLQLETVVSDDGPWADICGTALEGVSAGWDVAGQLAAETVWAVRLSFFGNRRVVIALGEVDRGVLRYNPAGLLVLFDERGLRSYKEPSVSQAFQLWQPVGSAARRRS